MTKEEELIRVRTALGKRIRELRLAKGYSQEELAHVAELDRSYIGGVERGERNVSIDNITKIALALKINLSELF